MSTPVHLHPNVRDQIGRSLLPQYQQQVREWEEVLSGQESANPCSFAEESFAPQARNDFFLYWLSAEHGLNFEVSRMHMPLKQIQSALTGLLLHQSTSLERKFERLGNSVLDIEEGFYKVLNEFSRYSCGIGFDASSPPSKSVYDKQQSKSLLSRLGIDLTSTATERQLKNVMAEASLNRIRHQLECLETYISHLSVHIKSVIQFYQAEQREYADPRFGSSKALRNRIAEGLHSTEELNARLSYAQRELESFRKSCERLSSVEPLLPRAVRGLTNVFRWIGYMCP